MIVAHPRMRQGGMIPNGPRVREAIVHVIREADKRELRLSQFDIAKALFFADRAHLNRFGRPITFDQYVAMPDGPVPSLAYDVLKDAIGPLQEAGIDEPLWTATPDGDRKVHFHSAVRDASEEILSESDLEALTEAVLFVKREGYTAIWDRVHRDKAYLDAWPKRGAARQYPMDLALLFDEPDPESAEAIQFASAYL